ARALAQRAARLPRLRANKRHALAAMNRCPGAVLVDWERVRILMAARHGDVSDEHAAVEARQHSGRHLSMPDNDSGHALRTQHILQVRSLNRLVILRKSAIPKRTFLVLQNTGIDR